MRDINPQRLSFIIAVIFALLVLLATVAGYLYNDDPYLILIGVGCAILAVVGGYFLVFYLIKRFIYSKIRIIYKTIHQSKRQDDRLELAMSAGILNEVENEVVEWAQERRDEIEQLRSQEAFRREFIGNLAHELKTPVFSIQGYILTLLEGALDDPDISHKFLERASKGVDRMTHILEDLDSITRFESGQVEMDFTEIDVLELVTDVMEGLEFKAQKKNVNLRMNKVYDRPIRVVADEGRIGQVLTNLMNNAINYSNDGGFVEIRFFDFDEHILIEVADDGVGISEKHLPRLFERFYRVDKSRSRHEGGTGLGLAIVKHIVDAHQQTINVRSTQGVGSTFSFTLKKAKG